MLVLDGPNRAHELHSYQCIVKQPTNTAAIRSPGADDEEDVKTQSNLFLAPEGQNNDGEGNALHERSLQLLDLPIDILKEIVKEVTHTNDLTSLALTCSALYSLAIPWIYMRFDIVWPDVHSNSDSRQGVDALTYGLATLVLGDEPRQPLQPSDANQEFTCTHCGTLNVVASRPAELSRTVRPRRRGNHYPQFTRQFSLGNGPDEWVEDYLINRESGKMLGTLVALALARMPNLESFVWDMPTGILRDCWLALASLSDGKDGRESKLEKVWVRFHNNRVVMDSPEALPTASQNTHHSSGHSSGPSHEYSSTTPHGEEPPGSIEWSYRHVEHPSFSILPPLKSLNVLNIDEIAYLEELSMLLERSADSLRELRIGLALNVPQDGFASTRDLNLHASDDVPSEYQNVLKRLMSKIYEADAEKCRKNVETPSNDGRLAESHAEQPHSTGVETLESTSVRTAGVNLCDSTNTQPLQTGIPAALPKPLPTFDPASILDSMVIGPSSTILDVYEGDIAPHTLSQAVANASKEILNLYQVPKQEPLEDIQSTLETSHQAQQEKRLKLELLELERVDLDVSVLRKTIDWSFITTLTLLHCDSHEMLWKAFRRTFTPQKNRSQPLLRRKSKVHLQQFYSSSSRAIPRSEYRMKLRRIHTNTVSLALIAFLKETLAPNSLEYLFLQDGGFVAGPSDERVNYESNVSIDAICRGPLRRHRSSLQKLMINSGDQGHGRRHKWQKWKLDREILLYLTSGKMTALREVAFSMDYKDWHVLLQRMPQVPHIRSIHIPHIADHPYGNHVNARELALQIMDIVTIRPDMQLCYMGISNKCFEILEGVHDDLESSSSSRTAANASSDDANTTDEDSDGSEEDHTNDENDTPTADDDSDFENQDDSGRDSDDELAESESFGKRPGLDLREILFYEDRVSIFKARHGRL